jgi:hypothetical protein
MKPSKARYQNVTVDVGFNRYSVFCRIVPGRKPAHVGADSPRFMDPGRPDRLAIFSAYRDGIDVTAALDVDLALAIERACSEKLGIKSRVAEPRETQGTLPMEAKA